MDNNLFSGLSPLNPKEPQDFKAFTYERSVHVPHTGNVQVFSLHHLHLNNSALQVQAFRLSERATSAGDLGPAIAFGLVGTIGVLVTGASLYYSRRADRQAYQGGDTCGVCLQTIATLLRSQPPRCPDCGSIRLPECEICSRPTCRARIFQTRRIEQEIILTKPARKCETCSAHYFVGLARTSGYMRFEEV